MEVCPDAFTATLLGLTVALMLAFSLGALPLIVGGALAGISSGYRPLQRLKEMV
jgi:hypothetical protein